MWGFEESQIEIETGNTTNTRTVGITINTNNTNNTVSVESVQCVVLEHSSVMMVLQCAHTV